LGERAASRSKTDSAACPCHVPFPRPQSIIDLASRS
jgi:hypothetical protein